jgi:hypothetical protein
MSTPQKPIELILARNLMTSITTPAFLVDVEGTIVFYNEAAGLMLGKRYEEAGQLRAADWAEMFGPYDSDGSPIPFDHLPITASLMRGRPAHGTFSVKAGGEDLTMIELSALPLVGNGGFRGALAIFWPVGSDAITAGTPAPETEESTA